MTTIRVEKIENISECAEILESDLPLWEKLGFRKALPKTKFVIDSEKVRFINIGLGNPYKVGSDVLLGEQILTGQLLKEVPIEEEKPKEVVPQEPERIRRKRKTPFEATNESNSQD